jgi:hypothetical protein
MKPITLHAALHDRRLLGAALDDRHDNFLSWEHAWFPVLKASYGETLTDTEQEAFGRVAGDRPPPAKKVKRLVLVVPRRGGKGRMTAALAVHEAALVDHSAHLAPGETGVVACVSPTRKQAEIIKDYALGFFQRSPILKGAIADVVADEIRLANGNIITTLTADYRSLRGRTLLLAILDEASFLRDENSATPDIEAARALLPGLQTTKGMLVISSSPYRKTGLLYQVHRDHFGRDSRDTLVVAGSSFDFNPTLDQEAVEAEISDDPESGRSEWLGEWRADLAAFLDDATIESAIDRNRPLELPPRPGVNYVAFVDASAGRHDAFTIAIAHAEKHVESYAGKPVETIRYIVDLVRGRKPPCDPHAVAAEFAALARDYNCRTVTGDHYAGEWTASAFRSGGANYATSERNRSDIYLEGLPLWSRGLVSIPEQPQLLRELRLLERRTTRLGKDSVDHGKTGSDDFSNVVFGALVLAATQPIINRAYCVEMVQKLQTTPPTRYLSIAQRRRNARSILLMSALAPAVTRNTGYSLSGETETVVAEAKPKPEPTDRVADFEAYQKDPAAWEAAKRQRDMAKER